MEPKWDGFRLLVAIDRHGRVRVWSRRGTSLAGHLGSLLAPLAEARQGTVVDRELVALSSCHGRAVQDFGAVCRAALHADRRGGQQVLNAARFQHASVCPRCSPSACGRGRGRDPHRVGTGQQQTRQGTHDQAGEEQDDEINEKAHARILPSPGKTTPASRRRGESVFTGVT